MKAIMKYAGAITLTTALALAAMMPSHAYARGGRTAAAAGIGFAAGAIVGAAAASANNGYYSNYYNAPGYGYYDGSYAYEPATVYVEPRPVYVQPAPTYYQGRGCWHASDDARGYGYYGPCY